MTSKITAGSLKESVYEALRESIILGERMPGDRLVEAQLSEEFGTSKTPVREALIRLKRDGLVEDTLHKISRVAGPSAADVREACEVRSWIEVALARRAAAAPDPKLVTALRRSIEDGGAALASSDTRAYVRAARSFSDEIVRASGNRHAWEALERLRNPLALIANLSRARPGRRERSLDEHRAILAAIAAGDPDAAAAATMQHLRSIEQDSLDALERWSGP